MSKTNKMIIVSSIVIIITLAVCIGMIIFHNKKDEYTVKFMINQTVYKEVKVAKNNRVEKPIDPERDGYIFIDWQFNGQTYNFETPIENNTLLIS